MADKSTEEKAKATLLQEPVKVTIGGEEYEAAPPSLATLILISEAVSRLPHISPDPENVMASTLKMAKDCRPIAEIIAILITGAKQIREERRKPWWGLTPFERLKRDIAENLSPQQLQETAATLLGQMQIADFFGLTTFLCEINMTKPTKVVTEATAPGQ